MTYIYYRNGGGAFLANKRISNSKGNVFLASESKHSFFLFISWKARGRYLGKEGKTGMRELRERNTEDQGC